MALRLSGMAAKNFALFVYAVLKDQKKTHGKTRLVRMLREQRPFKFFNIPPRNTCGSSSQKPKRTAYYTSPSETSKRPTASKWWCSQTTPPKSQRIFDNLGLDVVKAQAGEATIEKAPEHAKPVPAASAPGKTETVQTELGEVEFETGGFEDDFNIGPVQQGIAENFTSGRETAAGESAVEKSPFELSHPAEALRPAQQAIKNRSKSPR